MAVSIQSWTRSVESGFEMGDGHQTTTENEDYVKETIEKRRNREQAAKEDMPLPYLKLQLSAASVSGFMPSRFWRIQATGGQNGPTHLFSRPFRRI